MRDSIRQLLRLGLVVLVVAGLAMSGLALAQTSGDDTPTEESEEATPRFFRGPQAGRGLIGAAAEVLEMEASDIVDQLRAGATLAEIAQAGGSSTEAIVAVAVANLSERLDEAVADERITQEEAEERLAAAEERLTEAAESGTPIPDGACRHGFGKRGVHGGFGSDAVTDALGLTADELREALSNGQTLAEIAATQGVSTDDLVAAMTAGISEKLADAVADERITQAEADERLADIEEMIRERIETGFDGFGPRGDFGRRGPGRGGPGGVGGFGGFGPPTGEVTSVNA